VEKEIYETQQLHYQRGFSVKYVPDKGKFVALELHGEKFEIDKTQINPFLGPRVHAAL
jgi:hypothetical protein